MTDCIKVSRGFSLESETRHLKTNDVSHHGLKINDPTVTRAKNEDDSVKLLGYGPFLSQSDH